MSNTNLMALAAAPLPPIIANIRDDQLENKTPCTEFDVHGLVNHLLFWGRSIEAAAHKKVVPPRAASDTGIDLVGDTWRTDLEEQVERTVAAWGRAEAWDGMTYMGSPMELPAAPIGGMAMGEFVVHGWDLSRATGQNRLWDDGVLGRLLTEVSTYAEEGRQMGVYGPEVDVPASAPTLDRILGLTGRNPAWIP